MLIIAVLHKNENYNQNTFSTNFDLGIRMFKKYEMKIFVFFTAIIIFMTFTSCNYHKNYVYSPDKNQCITIISNKNIRYIIVGNHSSVPDTNYIKLDISKRYSFADNIIGTWKNKKYQWQIINDESIIIENKLDTLKYKFIEVLPKDSLGIPSTTIFRREKGFFYLGFDYGKIYESYNVVLE